MYFFFANYVLTLIGIAAASRKKRGGVGVNIAAGLELALIYIDAMKVTASLRKMLDVPNIIFGILGLIIYKFEPK